MHFKYSIVPQPTRIQRMAAKSLVVRIPKPCNETSVEMCDHNAIATVNQDRVIFGLEQDRERNTRNRLEVEGNVVCKWSDGLCAV